MTTTTPTTTGVGKPLAIGYTLTAIAAGVALEHGTTLAIIGGLAAMLVGALLLVLVAEEVTAAGPVAVAGATVALVLLAALGAAFVTLTAWAGLVVALGHGAAAVVLTIRARRS